MNKNKTPEHNDVELPEGEKGKTLETILELGKFYYVNRKFSEAMEQFNRALEMDPDNVEILLNIALIHEVNNDAEKAKEIYQKILKKNPDNSSAKEKINKLSGL